MHMLSKRGFYYLASPHSHPDPAVRRGRYEVARDAMIELTELGFVVYSPIASWHHVALERELPKDFTFYQRSDETMLCASLGMILLDILGHKESKGVQSEIAFCNRLGIPVWTITDALNYAHSSKA